MPSPQENATDGDSAGVDSHATTLKQYIVEDAASLAAVSRHVSAPSSDDWPRGEVAKTINGILNDGANASARRCHPVAAPRSTMRLSTLHEITGGEMAVMSRDSGPRVSQAQKWSSASSRRP